MSIKIQCPQCGNAMKVYEEHLGLRVRCPSPECGHRFVAAAADAGDEPPMDPEPETPPQPEESPFPVGAGHGDEEAGPFDQPESGNSALNMLMQAADDPPPPQREVRPKPSIRGDAPSADASNESARPARPVRPRVSFGGAQPPVEEAPAPRPVAKAPKSAPAPSPFPEDAEETEPSDHPENSGLAGLAAALGGGEEEPAGPRPASATRRPATGKRPPAEPEEPSGTSNPADDLAALSQAAAAGGPRPRMEKPRGPSGSAPTAKGKGPSAFQANDSLLGALAAAADGGGNEDPSGSNAPPALPPRGKEREPSSRSGSSVGAAAPLPVPVTPVAGAGMTPMGPVGLHLNAPVPMPKRINGFGIYLRALRPDDLPAFDKMLDDADLARTSSSVRSLAAARDSGNMERLGRDDSTLVMAVCLRDNDKLIGSVGMYDIDWRNRCARFEVLFVSGDQAVSGKGLRTNAARALAEHAFRELNVHRLWAPIYESSPRNRRLYGLLGFVEEGRLRQSYYCDGKYWDMAVWGLLAPEYFEKKRAEAAGAGAEAQPAAAGAEE